MRKVFTSMKIFYLYLRILFLTNLIIKAQSIVLQYFITNFSIQGIIWPRSFYTFDQVLTTYITLSWVFYAHNVNQIELIWATMISHISK